MRWMQVAAAALQAMKVGRALAAPEAWKNVQAVASLLTALLGILWALGFKIQVLPDDVFALAGAIAALVNAYLTVATSKKVGLPDVARSNPALSDGEVRGVSLDAGRDAAGLAAGRDAAVRMRDPVPSSDDVRITEAADDVGTGWNDR